jgi:phosphatidylcholine synthase
VGVRAGDGEPVTKHNAESDANIGRMSSEGPVTDGCYSQRDVRSAWAVHALTASGVIVGMVGLDSVIDGHARAAILWLVVALVLDGVDGPIARKLDVRQRIPLLDGNALDLIIDYFTCIIVPVAFLDRFDVLPDNTIATSGFVILFVSALWMARTDQETPDGWFRGFPAEWNVIIPTLYLLGSNRWFNLAVCAVLCAMTLSRVHFPHPVSVREQRPITLAFMFLWLGSMTWLAIAQERITWLRVVLILAPMWTLWQVLSRAWARSQNRVPVA